MKELFGWLRGWRRLKHAPLIGRHPVLALFSGRDMDYSRCCHKEHGFEIDSDEVSNGGVMEIYLFLIALRGIGCI